MMGLRKSPRRAAGLTSKENSEVINLRHMGQGAKKTIVKAVRVQKKKPVLARSVSSEGKRRTPDTADQPKPGRMVRSRTVPSTAESITPETPGPSSSASEGPNKALEAEVERLRTALAESQSDNERLTASVEQLQAARWQAQQKASEVTKLEAAVKEREQEAERLVAETEAQRKEAARLQQELQKQKRARQDVESMAQAQRLRADEAEAHVRQRDVEVATFAQRSLAQEELRRKMHETIQELKGNVRVFCRLRPNGAGGSMLNVPASATDECELEVTAPADERSSGRSSAGEKVTRFHFDRVFGADASQTDVFREVSQLTQSALDGYNVCIFAYGQTGSGKTHTMDGPHGDRGIIPRAVEQVFARAAELADLGWSHTFEVSLLEIYNEELRDLMPDSKKGKLRVVDMSGKVSVPELSVRRVSSGDEIHELLDAAALKRKTASTNLNDHSSRSHYIFRLALTGTHADGATMSSELNLIDLAGSERVKESGVTGEAFTEAKNINKSLSSLGDVVAALATNAKHVPFRNSKLTHMLQARATRCVAEMQREGRADAPRARVVDAPPPSDAARRPRGRTPCRDRRRRSCSSTSRRCPSTTRRPSRASASRRRPTAARSARPRGAASRRPRLSAPSGPGAI